MQKKKLFHLQKKKFNSLRGPAGKMWTHEASIAHYTSAWDQQRLKLDKKNKKMARNEDGIWKVMQAQNN